MMFMEPLQIACPHCRRQSEVSVEWLIEEGQRCPDCGADLAALAAPIRSSLRDWEDFVSAVEFVMAIESRFGVAVADEDACRLADAGGLLRFLTDALRAEGGDPDEQAVWRELRSIAADELGLGREGLARETDVFVGLRRVVGARTGTIRA